MTGSHEVSGSIPLIPTKTKSHSERNGFFVLPGTRGARSAAIWPAAFFRRESADFSALHAENRRKYSRHEGGIAAGVSRGQICIVPISAFVKLHKARQFRITMESVWNCHLEAHFFVQLFIFFTVVFATFRFHFDFQQKYFPSANCKCKLDTCTVELS